MGNEGERLYIRCMGAHCDNFIESKEKNLSICEDQGNTFFGIYGLCEKPGCNFENLVREDHFTSSDLLILCPGCGEKTPVKNFIWKKSEGHQLTFETRCGGCERDLIIGWEVSK